MKIEKLSHSARSEVAEFIYIKDSAFCDCAQNDTDANAPFAQNDKKSIIIQESCALDRTRTGTVYTGGF
ncbi:hypothetical protein CCP3SC5AM1_30006 [Gammaproteobacteria bacterium]